MGTVYLITVRQLAGRSRVIIMVLLAVLPPFMAIQSTGFAGGPLGAGFEDSVINSLLAGSIVPIVVLTIASVAFANELEDRTLANLTLAPVSRWAIVGPKFLAAISVAAPLLILSALVTSHVAFGGDWRATAAVTLPILIEILTYSAIFLWLGLVTTRAIGFGLMYIVLWEGLFAGFVSGIRFLSIRHYTVALMHGFDERRFIETDTLSFAGTLGASGVVGVLFLVLAVWRLETMDVP